MTKIVTLATLPTPAGETRRSEKRRLTGVGDALTGWLFSFEGLPLSDPLDLATLEQQNENLRSRLNDVENILRIMSQQLQLTVQMALRHDWTLDGITQGKLVDREYTGTVEGKGVVQLPVPVPEKNWCAILVPQRQSAILTPSGGRAMMPKNGKQEPKLVTTE